MLVLVCDICQSSGASCKELICELCRTTVVNNTSDKREAKKLRILCLHGFRQTSKSFLGRTCALRKKLKSVAEFVFIDGPHELEFVPQFDSLSVSRSCSSVRASKPLEQQNIFDGNMTDSIPINWDVLMSDKNMASGSLDNGSQPDAEGPSLENHKPSQEALNSQKPIRPKRAWLVACDGTKTGIFDELQYLTQKSGWEESKNALLRALNDLGPFDGIMGFSQGASIAAVLCAMKQAGAIPDSSFKFAVIASGYLSQADEHIKIFHRVGKISTPSLHIFGVGGDDRQVSVQASSELLSHFDSRTAHTVRHNMGHIIPSTKSYVEEYKLFLAQFT